MKKDDARRKVDAPLRRDVKFLGQLLGEVLVEQEGQALFELEERIRLLSIRRRRGPVDGRSDAAAELSRVLSEIDTEQAEPVIRAFATYFQLVNLAEQHHRIRRARAHAIDPEPQRGSLEAILRAARARGISAEQARDAIRALEVTLTFTAHPTQAARRTVLEKLYRMARILEERDRCRLTPREADLGRVSLREEITTLWQSDELRHERPTVADEVKTVLWYLEEVLRDLLPTVSESLATAFEQTWGEPLGFLPTPLRLHSWVGGDMDGNPMVTAEVLEDTIRGQMVRGLRHHLKTVEQLGAVLSQSERRVKVPAALAESLAADARLMPAVAARWEPRTVGEPWRRKLRYVEDRLRASIARTEQQRADAFGLEPPAPVDEAVPYDSPDQLLADLRVVADTLREANAARAGERLVRHAIVQVQSLGFHVAELEMRAPADEVRAADEALRTGAEPSPEAHRIIDALKRIARAQREGGEQVCRTLILSMAQSAEDVLAAYRCAKACGLWDEARGCATIDVVPLFETLEALDAGPAILRELLAEPDYRKHLTCRSGQEVMVGYSDSGKEVGLLAASGALHRAQSALPKIAREAGIPLRLFHGRGESVARGGGPAQEAILALPRGSVAGRYKATEQGEALDHKYSRPELALRTLELVLGGVLLHSLDAQNRPDEETERRYAEAFDVMAEEGRKAYRALVWDEPRFIDFFNEATPIDEIARLPIGSRPSKRRAGGLETLRAIPWVFAWTQNRAILPGWYGVGTALERFAEREGGTALVCEMYERWPFFRAVIDKVEMVLAKADLDIAARYAELASPAARKAVWRPIRREFRRTKKWIKTITVSRKLLDGNPPLQRSIRLRNPYVDPMSFLQVELLARKRRGDLDCDRALALTLTGIASGMRNTG